MFLGNIHNDVQTRQHHIPKQRNLEQDASSHSFWCSLLPFHFRYTSQKYLGPYKQNPLSPTNNSETYEYKIVISKQASLDVAKTTMFVQG
jgi:hypothetical protein